MRLANQKTLELGKTDRLIEIIAENISRSFRVAVHLTSAVWKRPLRLLRRGQDEGPWLRDTLYRKCHAPLAFFGYSHGHCNWELQNVSNIELMRWGSPGVYNLAF